MEIREDKLICAAQTYIGYLERKLSNILSKREFKTLVGNHMMEYYYTIHSYIEKTDEIMREIRIFIATHSKGDQISQSLNKNCIINLKADDLFSLNYDFDECRFYSTPMLIENLALQTKEDLKQLHNIYQHRRGALIRHIKLTTGISKLNAMYTPYQLKEACRVFILSTYGKPIW